LPAGIGAAVARSTSSPPTVQRWSSSRSRRATGWTTALKQRRLIATARDYLTRQRLHDVPCRFDVVAVRLTDAGLEVELFQNAFDASG